MDMNKNFFFVLIITLLGIVILYGCSSSSDKDSKVEGEDTYVELDVDYTMNDDGTYTYDNNIYKYKIEVSGTEANQTVTYVILTNDKETDFDEVSYSFRKAEVSTGKPEFVVLGWY